MPQRILIIDDDVVDRASVRRCLKASGLVVDLFEAATARDGLTAAAECAPDCILLDYMLPDGNGIDVLHRLGGRNASAPIIALTGQSDQEVAVAMMKAGAADYLTKDALASDRLERSIRYAIAMFQVERERRAMLEREQKALAEAREANRAKDEFLATLSHELRTPLNTILGWTRLLASGTLDPATATRALQTIERNTTLQVKLIDDLLDISRIISGKLTLEPTPVHVDALISVVVDSYRPVAAQRDVTLTLTVDGTQRAVLGDAARLQQVFTNLLSNAMKFIEDGGHIDVTVAFRGDRVSIRVSDTGAGIDPAFLPYVFDRFRQADASSVRRHGGLGLGLSIVRHLVERHGGTVTAASDGPGRGATFTVDLPVSSQESASPRTPGAFDDLPSLADLHVLVVDDDVDARELITTVLTARGARVTSASSAEEALGHAVTSTPDVLVSDIGMPRHDGYELIRRIRALQPDRTFPAIAVTAFATPEDRTRALLAGFQAHLAKPVEPRELVLMIATLCGRTVPMPASH